MSEKRIYWIGCEPIRLRDLRYRWLQMSLPSTRRMNIPFSLLSRRIAVLSLAGSLAAGATQVLAADGTWISDASGNWNAATTAPWQSGIVASGIDANAYFNKIDVTGARTVTLTENLTVGNLFFGDTSGTQTWTLARSATSVLTLQTTTGTPTITVDNSAVTISAALGGTQGYTKAGTGKLVLTGNNTGLTGQITVNAGTLDIWTTNSIGSNNINLVSATSTLDNANFASVSTTISGDITGSGRIIKTSGVSGLVLAGNNTFTGGVEIQAGSVEAGSGLNNGVGTGTLSFKGGAFLSTDNNARTFTNVIAMGSNALRFGAVQDAATGKGDLTFAWTGSTAVGGNKSWTVNNSTRVTFKNSWAGNSDHNITKLGTGTLVFDGNITGSSGVGITVTAGTMLLNGSKSTSNAVTVNSGGTFGGNSPSMAGVFTVNAGGAISPGDGGIGTLNATNLTWNGEASGAFAQMKFELSNVGGQSTAATADRLALGSGILSKGSGSIFTFDFLGTGAAGNTYTLMTFGSSSGFSVGDFTYTNLTNGLDGTFALNAGSLTFTVVPEPTTFALLGAGLMVAIFARPRRRD